MKQKDILIIIILFFIFIIAWIGGGIYHSAVNSTISEETNEEISPITPAFDTKVIDKLKKRQKIVPSFELENLTPTPIILPTTAIPSTNASKGATILL